jgi:Type IV secretion system pilin
MEHLGPDLLNTAQTFLVLVNDTFGASFAHAQASAGSVGAERLGSFVPISQGFEQLLGISPQSPEIGGDFGQVVNSIYKLSIRIGGAVAVAMFVYGGIMYMVQPFGIAGEGISKAKERMQNAVLGLLMLLATWIIFNQINPDILNLKINATELKSLPTQTSAAQSEPTVVNEYGIEVKKNEVYVCTQTETGECY